MTFFLQTIHYPFKYIYPIAQIALNGECMRRAAIFFLKLGLYDISINSHFIQNLTSLTKAA